MPDLNTPPHIYITVLDDLHNTAQMYMYMSSLDIA